MTPLSQATLSEIGGGVAVPAYDRAKVKPGVVHFGVGNFHRVHLAVYLDRCLAKPGNEGWGICGVELMDFPAARAKEGAYKAQDCLYTVTESAPDGTAETRVIGAMVEYLHAPADPEAVLTRLADPATKIVSLTITEGGYNIDERTDTFDTRTPDVASDLAGNPLKTAFGFIVEGLARRRAAGLPAFTVMSCDNLRHNGDTARKAMVSFAAARDPALGAWVDKEAAFPNSAWSTASRRRCPRRPVQDQPERPQRHPGCAVPALGEDFMQFVLEDRVQQLADRISGPSGVELRDDVGVFEVMKQRVLNASHMMLGYPGLLCGYRIVHEAMADNRFFRLLDTFQDHDVIPHLEAPRGVSLKAYKEKVLERFANPAVNDQLQRLALDGWAKFGVYHLKILEALIASGSDLRREAFFLACIEAYLKGRDDKGESFTVHEPSISEAEWGLIRGDDPVGFLRGSPFVNLGLADHPTSGRCSCATRRGSPGTAQQDLDALLAETAS